MIKEQKEEMLKGQCFLYVDTVQGAKDLVKKLNTAGITSEFVVGVRDMSSAQRKNAMDKWEAGTAKVLVGTDAMGVGIDQDVRLVIICGLPQDLENFWQKVGRAGRRAATQGVAVLYWRLGDLQSIGYKVKYAMHQEKE
jgi:ATP-dependent DNA helicase RecQ